MDSKSDYPSRSDRKFFNGGARPLVFYMPKEWPEALVGHLCSPPQQTPTTAVHLAQHVICGFKLMDDY